MERYRVKIRGVRPLLMNAPTDLSNYPTRRRGEHLPPKEEAEMRLYKDKEGRICVPAVNIKAMLRDAGRNYRVRGRRSTFGAIIRAAIEIRPFMVPLKHDEWKVDVRPVVVQRQRILRARPRFDNWELEFEIINKDPDMIPADMVKKILIDAGKYYGLCDFRPEFGLFEVVEFETISTE